MARTKTAPSTSDTTSKKETPSKQESPADSKPTTDGMRETVESVVVAFVLAFLFRTFEAEAFVIPTGSMAPTLMGRHKEMVCENCSYPYRVTGRDEVNKDGALVAGNRLEATQCPNCQYMNDLGSARQQAKYPSFTGDRLLVGKFPYSIGEPKRWDVIVFKYPIESHQNFIKRLVGLPGERLRIQHGDIFVQSPGEADFRIARKPPEKLQAMLQVVYDNDFIGPETLEGKVPPRWQGENWSASNDMRSFVGAGDSEGWLRYSHLYFAPGDWESMKNGKAANDPRDFVRDLNGYNMAYSNINRGVPNSGPIHWVGDLAIECEVELGGTSGELLMELVEGGVRFQCRINVETGEATLSHTGDPTYGPTGKTHVKGPGVYRVAFCNVDDQLVLWVDGKTVQFDSQTEYSPVGNFTPQDQDFSPVGLMVRGVKAKVSHLRVLRDIYYIATRYGGSNNPAGEEFPLEQDQFFVLGDNSAESLDARYWTLGGDDARFVHRDLLIGKALFVYWPHGWYDVPGTGIPFYVPGFDVPMFPNFARMGLVR